MKQELDKELLEELSKIAIKLKDIPDMDGLEGLNCFSGDIEEYEELGNSYEKLKPFLDEKGSPNHKVIKLSLLKAGINDILNGQHKLWNNIETQSFLSAGDY